MCGVMTKTSTSCYYLKKKQKKKQTSLTAIVELGYNDTMQEAHFMLLKIIIGMLSYPP